jgi:hypothetical protein
MFATGATTGIIETIRGSPIAPTNQVVHPRLLAPATANLRGGIESKVELSKTRQEKPLNSRKIASNGVPKLLSSIERFDASFGHRKLNNPIGFLPARKNGPYKHFRGHIIKGFKRVIQIMSPSVSNNGILSSSFMHIVTLKIDRGVRDLIETGKKGFRKFSTVKEVGYPNAKLFDWTQGM